MKKKYKKLEKEQKKKWAKQRAKRGYADVDWWNIDTWFVDNVSKMLKKLKKYHHGYPHGLIPENSPDMENYDEAADKKWTEILGRMIFLLHEMNEDKCSKKNPYEKRVEEANKKFVREYGYFGEKYKTGKENDARLWKTACDIPENRELFKAWSDGEAEIAEYRDACKDEFFELFSKYFWNLWD